MCDLSDSPFQAARKLQSPLATSERKSDTRSGRLPSVAASGPRTRLASRADTTATEHRTVARAPTVPNVPRMI